MTALQQLNQWARLDDKDRTAVSPPVGTHRLELEFKARQTDALERIAQAIEVINDRQDRAEVREHFRR